jgi:hypothetical protein
VVWRHRVQWVGYSNRVLRKDCQSGYPVQHHIPEDLYDYTSSPVNDTDLQWSCTMFSQLRLEGTARPIFGSCRDHQRRSLYCFCFSFLYLSWANCIRVQGMDSHGWILAKRHIEICKRDVVGYAILSLGRKIAFSALEIPSYPSCSFKDERTFVCQELR